MTLNKLTGQKIQDTYQRIVQTDGTNLADGTGSLLPISFEGNNVIISGSLSATEYTVTSSVTNVVFQQQSGSTIFGDSLDDTHVFTGSIQITGSELRMKDVYAADSGIDEDLIITSRGISHKRLGITREVFSIDGTRLVFGEKDRDDIDTVISGSTLRFNSHADTNFDIDGNDFRILSGGVEYLRFNNTTGLILTGSVNVTGSGHITSSGIISASGGFIGNLTGTINGGFF